MTNRQPFRVLFANSVLDFIDEHVTSEHVLARIETYRELLSQYPALGAAHDPDYPAARPPIVCRRLPVPDTPFTLYYAIDEEHRNVNVFYIEFKGADPMTRFDYSGLY